MPLYVKKTLLSLAHVTETISDAESSVLSVCVYGEKPQSFILYSDDGSSNPTLTENRLEWNTKKEAAKMEPGFYRLGKEKADIIK